MARTPSTGRSFVADDELLAAPRMGLGHGRGALEAYAAPGHVVGPHVEVQRHRRALQSVLVPGGAGPCFELCRNLNQWQYCKKKEKKKKLGMAQT